MTTSHPSLLTRIAILQQSEYEWAHYTHWIHTHPEYSEEILPKEMTLKVRLLRTLAQMMSLVMPTDRALAVGLFVLSLPQWMITTALLFAARIKLRFLQHQGLRVIAIAGSYAKTSTKHILFHILSQEFETLATPGNINQPIGIAREILFHLHGSHKFFVVELGEYDRGDIRQMTRFVRPSIVVITPITIAHFERFANEEEIETEIFDAVRYAHADTYVHEKNEPLLKQQGIESCTVYTSSAISKVFVSRAGTEYSVDGHSGEFFIPLFGRHNAENTLPAILIAMKLGMNSAKIRSALSSLPFVPHRLEPTLLENNILLLDNGYNANPQSSKETLSVLAAMDGSAKIVCTPGFVELGERQDEENEKLGKAIAKVATLCIVMDGVNTQSLIQGLHSGGMKDEDIYIAKDEVTGMNMIGARLVPSSIVLFENSIPQLYQK